MPNVAEALLYAAAPAIAIPASAVVVADRPPSTTARGLLQQFAAGGLIAVVAVELLGHLDQEPPWALVIGVATGTALMTGLGVASSHSSVGVADWLRWDSWPP